MRPVSRSASQGSVSLPSPASTPMRRYTHPIPIRSDPALVVPAEGLQWIYATLYAQSTALEEIKALLKSGNKL